MKTFPAFHHSLCRFCRVFYDFKRIQMTTLKLRFILTLKILSVAHIVSPMYSRNASLDWSLKELRKYFCGILSIIDSTLQTNKAKQKLSKKQSKVKKQSDNNRNLEIFSQDVVVQIIRTEIFGCDYWELRKW